MPAHTIAPSGQSSQAAGTRKGRWTSGRVWRITSTPMQTTAKASSIPMEIRSASTSSGNTPAISAAPIPVTTVDTCGVLKRG